MKLFCLCDFTWSHESDVCFLLGSACLISSVSKSSNAIIKTSEFRTLLKLKPQPPSRKFQFNNSQIGAIFQAYLVVDIAQQLSDYYVLYDAQGQFCQKTWCEQQASYLVFTLLGLRIISAAWADYGYCKLNVSDKISVGDFCRLFYCALEGSQCESNNWVRFKLGVKKNSKINRKN